MDYLIWTDKASGLLHVGFSEFEWDKEDTQMTEEQIADEARQWEQFKTMGTPNEKARAHGFYIPAGEMRSNQAGRATGAKKGINKKVCFFLAHF